MIELVVPAIWIIVMIIGLGQLSETVYTPSLPEIARALSVSESMVEHTLTIYLFSFALGMLFWGTLSDKIGRKPCILVGLVIFILGTMICFISGLSSSITILMIGRFIQAFGASTGSVIGQAICRDVFQGQKLGMAYSSIGTALAVFPAVGPFVGGYISESFGWNAIFLFLILFAMLSIGMIIRNLPETHHEEKRQQISLIAVCWSLLKDRKVMAYTLIIAGCNGIAFSYFAEGAFYLIQFLGLSPSQYGSSFIFLAAFTMLGGMTSKQLHVNHSTQKIMGYGIAIMVAGTALFTTLIMFNMLVGLPNSVLICIVLGCHMITIFGLRMVISTGLALGLVDYTWCIGTASSFFGFAYYCVTSVFTLGMGILHNGSLLPMPLYFLAISLFMYVVNDKLLNKIKA